MARVTRINASHHVHQIVERWISTDLVERYAGKKHRRNIKFGSGCVDCIFIASHPLIFEAEQVLAKHFPPR